MDISNIRWKQAQIIPLTHYDPYLLPVALDFPVPTRDRYPLTNVMSHSPLEEIGRTFEQSEWLGKKDMALDHLPDETRQPFLERPEYAASGGSGNYTGFNSVELQEIYAVQTQAAIRSQISPRGEHKPCMALLPNGDLLATQKANGQHIALCRIHG